MRKIVGTSLVRHLRDRFPEFTDGDHRRVFLWDEGHGYPDARGRIVPVDLLPRPFALVQVTGGEAEAATIGPAGLITDRVDVRVHVVCRPPEDAPYQAETLPEAVRAHLAATDVEFADEDRTPPVLVDRARAERAALPEADPRGTGDPLTLYRGVVRLRYVFYRSA